MDTTVQTSITISNRRQWRRNNMAITHTVIVGIQRIKIHAISGIVDNDIGWDCIEGMILASVLA